MCFIYSAINRSRQQYAVCFTFFEEQEEGLTGAFRLRKAFLPEDKNNNHKKASLQQFFSTTFNKQLPVPEGRGFLKHDKIPPSPSPSSLVDFCLAKDWLHYNSLLFFSLFPGRKVWEQQTTPISPRKGLLIFFFGLFLGKWQQQLRQFIVLSFPAQPSH